VRKPVWLQKAAVLAIHAECLRQHGGADGIRDESLLESALARPLHLFAYEKVDLRRLAAAYAIGIVQNHPFVDGNKRTGFLAAAVFLERKGVQFTADPAHAAVFVLGVADGTLGEEAFAAWLRDNTRSRARRAGTAKRPRRK
jgi:death on curing protein